MLIVVVVPEIINPSDSRDYVGIIAHSKSTTKIK